MSGKGLVMVRYCLAVASAILLLAASLPSKSDTEIPAEIAIPSSVGEVIFRHKKHIEDRAIPCVECHHQINAKKLNTPHPDYLRSSWINCTVCHEESGQMKQSVHTCSACHHTNPVNIADETLSAKVVIHRQCWKCHPVSTGKDASKGCEKCHSGKKTL
jgi:hypothetical protein